MSNNSDTHNINKRIIIIPVVLALIGIALYVKLIIKTNTTPKSTDKLIQNSNAANLNSNLYCSIEGKTYFFDEDKVEEYVDFIFNNYKNGKYIYVGTVLLDGWRIELPSGKYVWRSFLRDHSNPIVKIGIKGVPYIYKWVEDDNLIVKYIAIYSLEQITHMNSNIFPRGISDSEEDVKKFLNSCREWYKKMQSAR